MIKRYNDFDLYKDRNPRFKIRRMYGKYPSNLTMGFENEIAYHPKNSSRMLNDKVSTFMLINPYLYMKEEASIDGIEINSHPFNWNWFLGLTKNPSESNFMKELSALKSHNNFSVNNDCGFHVHLARKFFDKKHLIKMIKFFYEPKHINFLHKISKRTKYSFTEWANPKIPTYEKDYKKHCHWHSKKVPYTFKEMASFKGDKFDVEVGTKCSILNLYPKKTIEIRLFKGTTNPKLFKAYLEFAMAISLFTKDTEYDMITIKEFRKYAKKNRKEYKCLYRLITNPKSLKA